MSVSDLGYWLFVVPLQFLKINVCVAGFSFTMWDVLIFTLIVGVLGKIVSVLFV